MMYQKVIARRYAKGLKLALGDEHIDQVESELKDLLAILSNSDHELFRLFFDPSFTPIERKAVIRRMVQSFGMSKVLGYFLFLLVDKGRLSMLPAIHEAFISLIDKSRKRLRAVIKSAKPLDDEYLGELKDALMKISRKEVLLKSELEPELLGGVRVEMSGMVFDGTIRAKLDAIKERLINEVATI